MEKDQKTTLDKDLDFYTIEQAASRLQCGTRYVRDQINKGLLPTYKRGKRQYILHQDILAYIRSGKKSNKNEE